MTAQRPAATAPRDHDGTAVVPQPPYGGDSERDRQVRARLAELTEGTGISVEEILRQLAKARSCETAFPDPDPELLRDDAERGVRVVRQRPGDGQWGVESRISQGPATAQPRPCSGEKVCPWRLDAPTGQFPARVFEHSAPGNRTAGAEGPFGCHSSPEDRTLLCAGWLLAGADGNQQILAMMDDGTLARPELPAGVGLYASYAEMAVANGVDPALPELHPVPDDFIPFTRSTFGARDHNGPTTVPVTSEDDRAGEGNPP
ncbi:DUF6283 family protein [Kitasatospora sp. NPDC089797]|uniref:DUF6283 family protein n=1 Tax=Kitasatospora sp. NPDC089797 TaxID=3155298 RepID=UPI00342F2D79